MVFQWFLQEQDILNIKKMLRKILLTFFFMTIFTGLTYVLELPEELLGIKLGEKFNEIKKTFKLKKEKNNFYRIVYTENTNIVQTYLKILNSKVAEIEVIYNENFLDEDDLTNIYNKIKEEYGKPHKFETKKENNKEIEIYMWQEERKKLFCEIERTNNKTKNIKIKLIDIFLSKDKNL